MQIMIYFKYSFLAIKVVAAIIIAMARPARI